VRSGLTESRGKPPFLEERASGHRALRIDPGPDHGDTAASVKRLPGCKFMNSWGAKALCTFRIGAPFHHWPTVFLVEAEARTNLAKSRTPRGACWRVESCACRSKSLCRGASIATTRMAWGGWRRPAFPRCKSSAAEATVLLRPESSPTYPPLFIARLPIGPNQGNMFAIRSPHCVILACQQATVLGSDVFPVLGHAPEGGDAAFRLSYVPLPSI